MNKEQARIDLERWLYRKSTNNVPEGCYNPIMLPIYDEVVFGEMVGNEIREYTFRYLMCLAYDLQEKKTERL